MVEKILNASVPFASMSSNQKIELMKKLFLTYHDNHALLLCLVTIVLFASRRSTTHQ